MIDKIRDQIPIIFLIILSIIIAIPLAKYILFSLIITGIAYPIYTFLYKKLKIKIAASAIAIILILAAFTIPLSYIILETYRELYNLAILKFDIPSTLKNLQIIYDPKIWIEIVNFIYARITLLVKDLVGYFLSILLSFYILVYSDNIQDRLSKIESIQKYIKKISEKFYKIVFGHILFWSIQAGLSYLGFILLDIPYPTLLSLLVFILAVLPILGPWTVWAGVAIYFYLTNNIFAALFSVLYGIIFIAIILEILIKPILVGKTSDINPALIFIGVVGGVSLFDLPGIIVGPLLIEIGKDIILEYLDKH